MCAPAKDLNSPISAKEKKKKHGDPPATNVHCRMRSKWSN